MCHISKVTSRNGESHRGAERAARLLRLLEYLNENDQPVAVQNLAALASSEFGVSEVTLRSDLAALCALRGIRKSARATYEAIPAQPGGSRPAGTLFETRLQHRAEAKIAIAGAVAMQLVAQPDLRVLLLDGGTTTYYVADRLAERPGLDLLIWTPNVAAAGRLGGARGLSVRLLGGEYDADYAVVSGDETARALRALAANSEDTSGPLMSFPGAHCVLDINHVSPEGRLYTDESTERLQKRLMAELAEELTLVADASKLFAPRLGILAHEVYGLSDFRGKRAVRLVTDASALDEQRRQARALFETAFPGYAVAENETESALVFTAARLCQ
jgi:DeoR/GlpR family transcriptional regulator of sugar metabolism